MITVILRFNSGEDADLNFVVYTHNVHFRHRVALSSAIVGYLVLAGGIYASYLVWPDFQPLSQTFSSLAALNAPTRSMVTAVMVTVGVCQLVIAWGFQLAKTYGRLLIGSSGIAVFGVAAFPVPEIFADSNVHTFMAGVVLISMCLWPIFSIHHHHLAPWMLSTRGAWTVTVAQAVVGLVFLAAWLVNHRLTGLLEMLLLSTQSAIVILATYFSTRNIARHAKNSVSN